MTNNSPITVSSHVSRDFLQNAAYFSTLPKVLWEYISNSLDNASDNRPVNVAVEIQPDRIVVTDDAAGMSRPDLQSFFQMHGENRQRLRGKRVRGRFGTGKCAAFGIANLLRIDTVRNGKRNVVELHRDDIQSARTGEPFPVKDCIVNSPTDLNNGTRVEVEDLNTKNLDLDSAIAYVEHHLSRYRQRAHVTIQGHECRFQKPAAAQSFAFSPPAPLAQHIGPVVLTVNISPSPLDSDSNGVDIFSHGIWHETTLAGVDRREMSQFLFGEVDVPILEDGDWPIPPFDNTRNGALNVNNPVVAMLYGWIQQSLDDVRQRLVEAEKARRDSEEAKMLQKEAARIAEILNEDFKQLQVEIEFAKQVSTRQGSQITSERKSLGDVPLPGEGDLESELQEAGNPHGNGKRGSNNAGEGEEPRPGPSLIPGSAQGSPRATDEGTRKRRSGLFAIDYRNETPEGHRSRYDRDTRTIVINLDHPQMAGAFATSGRNTEARHFREVSYEVAIVEYAQAIPYEKLRPEGDYYRTAEALYDVRETINRVSRRIAEALG